MLESLVPNGGDSKNVREAIAKHHQCNVAGGDPVHLLVNTALDEQESAEEDEHADHDLEDVHVLVKQVIVFTMLLLSLFLVGPDSCAGVVANGYNDSPGISLHDLRLAVRHSLIRQDHLAIALVNIIHDRPLLLQFGLTGNCGLIN